MFREVYRDRWLLVVDKASGTATQQTRDGEPNLYQTLVQAERYVGLHHRLDRPASGLLLFALDERANAALAAGFREHTIRRGYRAVLAGEPREDSWRRPVDGREARTAVAVVGSANGMSAVELSLHTGRKHQIRQQAAMAGTPVVGDRRYGGEAGHGWPRLALHAWRLELAHPVTGEPFSAESPIPGDLRDLWQLAGGS